MDDTFEWDEAKARANLAQHAVDFEEAIAIFRGLCLEVLDTREDYGEERCISLGMTQGRCYVVTHTVRAGKIRIISARRANKREQTHYFKEVLGKI